MDSINTVNFEDLFDFSPEPAPGHQQQTSVGGASGGVFETADEALEKPRSTNQYQENKASNASGEWVGLICWLQGLLAGSHYDHFCLYTFFQF